jgi:phenylacetate-CoA ligase
MKRVLIFSGLFIQDKLLKLLIHSQSVHKVLFAPGFERYRWTVGKLRAWQTFEFAAKHVPAYAAFLKKHNANDVLPEFDGLQPSFASIPEMDKSNYIKKWSITERCIEGKLPVRGVVVDESSGSTGTPTSWVRGPYERRAVRSLLQIGFQGTARQAQKPIFILNAFSLGAWATGMNVSASLTDVSIIKSIGPDKEKIIATMQEFGPNYTYVILSYPPFLKDLVDDSRIEWKKYDVIAGFGGEGMSENMRTYLLKSVHGVFGSYGASDLEINIAIETDFTVALRRAIASDEVLATKLTAMSEYGVLPMIFQYNPYDYVIETNKHGELLVTISRKENINPRIRYNIHDRGHVIRVRKIRETLEAHGYGDLLQKQRSDLPLLFHYGRSDLSVDYNGAVVAPDALRDIIYANEDLLANLHNHRLISFEDKGTNKQLHIALQLKEGFTLTKSQKQEFRQMIFTQLLATNNDFKHACQTVDEKVFPSLQFYQYHKGPFEQDGKKLKNEYVWHLNAHEIEAAKMDISEVLDKNLL